MNFTKRPSNKIFYLISLEEKVPFQALGGVWLYVWLCIPKCRVQNVISTLGSVGRALDWWSRFCWSKSCFISWCESLIKSNVTGSRILGDHRKLMIVCGLNWPSNEHFYPLLLYLD